MEIVSRVTVACLQSFCCVQRIRNWVSSDAELDEPIPFGDDDDDEDYADAPQVSAGRSDDMMSLLLFSI